MASVKRLWRLCARVPARAKTSDGRRRHFEFDASIDLSAAAAAIAREQRSSRRQIAIMKWRKDSAIEVRNWIQQPTTHFFWVLVTLFLHTITDHYILRDCRTSSQI